MHQTQQKILELAKQKNLGMLSLRQIGNAIGVEHPQKVKYHLNRLIACGLLEADLDHDNIQHIPTRQEKGGLFAIPILGIANAGPASAIAEEQIIGHLRVSKQLIPQASGKLFAVRVSGDSMNRAKINGKNIEDGDLVIVDSGATNPANNDIILSIIGDVANIKRFTRDQAHRQVILSSDSNREFAPIYIHEEDQSDYIVTGVVIDVFKKPTIN